MRGNKPSKLISSDKEFDCPESKRTWYSDKTRCNRKDKYCLYETGDKCVYYDDWKKETDKEVSSKRLRLVSKGEIITKEE